MVIRQFGHLSRKLYWKKQQTKQNYNSQQHW